MGRIGGEAAAAALAAAVRDDRYPDVRQAAAAALVGVLRWIGGVAPVRFYYLEDLGKGSTAHGTPRI